MTDLTEKNLEAALLNLTKTDKPITVKPTTWFGNPAKTAQWYRCPKCAEQSPLTLEWVDLSTIQILDIYAETLKEHRGGSMPDGQIAFAKAIEQALKERNT
jgi:hypothetical protein